MTKLREYALYRGDVFVSVGTAVELAEEMGVQPKTIQFLSTPSYKRRMDAAKQPRGKRKYTVKLEDEDND